MKYGYKIIATLLAFGVIAVAIFTPLVAVSIDSLVPGVLVLLGSYLLKSDTAADLLEEYEGAVPSAIGEKISIYNFINPSDNSIASLIKNLSGQEVSETATEVLQPIIPDAIVFAVVFCLIIVCALAVAITACVCENNRIVMYLSIVGCGLNFMLFKTFGDVAGPFLSGEITLSDIAGSDWIGLLGNITGLEVPSTMWFIAVLFVCIIIWTVLYNLTLPENEKIERKRMLGELD